MTGQLTLGLSSEPTRPVLGEGARVLCGFALSEERTLLADLAAGARLTMHQDRNERDFSAPIVSVSLGVPATFVFGGFERNERATRVVLDHGDVVVWGGPDRLRYHGVLPLKLAHHPSFGTHRINLTFRKAG